MSKMSLRLLAFFSLLILTGWGGADADEPATFSAPQAEIHEAWRIRREILSVGRENFSTKELDRVKEIEQNFGLTSITSVSFALLNEVQDHQEDSQDTQATRISYAQKF